MDDLIPQTTGQHYTGRCHCGSVAFACEGPLRPIVICHCLDCLRIAGMSWGATSAAHNLFRITKGEEMIDWYASSDFAKRGFCETCHAQMFYQLADSDRISIAPGMLDNHDGLYSKGHIFRESLPACCVHDNTLPDIERY